MQSNAESFIPDVAVNTKYGELEGTRNSESSTISWLGIPYAKPPVGALRWKAPENPEHWTGKYQADQYGQSCIQTVNGKIEGSEDCLYLNIWRPDLANSKLPVFVFAHGGGNVGGSGKDFVGDRLARSMNSVVITVNYRLGAMGFFRHPSLQSGNPLDDSGNYGLLDIIQSLKWVQDHISHFGGDPGNVTLAGQSAGARNVMAAIISPVGKGLFHKAVSLSGGMTTSDPKAGEKKANEILVKLVIEDGIADTVDEARLWINEQKKEKLAAYLRQIKPEKMVTSITDPAIQMAPFPHLFRDGAVIPHEGFERIEMGDYNKVPMILGSDQTEFSGFAAGDTYFGKSLDDGSLFSDNKKRRRYQKAVEYGSELYAGFNVERSAEKLTAQEDQPAIYGYRFAWGTRQGVTSPRVQMLFGAAHGADLDFYTGYSTGLAELLGKDYHNEENKAGRQELSAAMVQYMKYFVYTGNPNSQQNKEWKPWTQGVERVLMFDGEKERAIIEMSNEYLTRDATINRMESELSKEESDFIKQIIFNGRFFWE